jgi:hypothetical protein
MRYALPVDWDDIVQTKSGTASRKKTGESGRRFMDREALGELAAS